MVNRLFRVNQIFLIFIFNVIIFLTGCAHRGYYISNIDKSGSRRNQTFSQASLDQNFLWPLRGEVVAAFGMVQDLIPLKGVLIESKTSDKVLAARDGKVVFELRKNLKAENPLLYLKG